MKQKLPRYVARFFASVKNDSLLYPVYQDIIEQSRKEMSEEILIADFFSSKEEMLAQFHDIALALFVRRDEASRKAYILADQLMEAIRAIDWHKED